MKLCVSGDRELYTAVGMCRCLADSSPCRGSSRMRKVICRIDSGFKTFITISKGCSTLIPGERTPGDLEPKVGVRTEIARMGPSKGLGLDIHRGTFVRVSGSTLLMLTHLRRGNKILPFGSGTSTRIVHTRFSLDGGTFGHTIKRLCGRHGVRVHGSDVILG